MDSGEPSWRRQAILEAWGGLGLTGKESNLHSFKKKKKSSTSFRGVKAMCSVQTWPQCGRKSPDFGVQEQSRPVQWPEHFL